MQTLIKAVIKVAKKSDMYNSTLKTSEMVQKILEENYEPGRHDRCKLWVYRNKVAPVLGISERTFWRMIQPHIPEDRVFEPLLFDIDEFLEE